MRRWVVGAGVAVLVGAVAEIALLVLLVWWIGQAWTLGLLIVKAVLGYLLVRRVGGRGWRRLRAAVGPTPWSARGASPDVAGPDAAGPSGRDVSETGVGVAGALLIMIAGFLGAAVGAALLAPPVRRWVTTAVEGLVERRLSAAVAGDVFGPRRVRAQRAATTTVRTEPVTPAAAGPDGPPAAIEGEILPPR